MGKSMPSEGAGKCLAFVQTYDQKPKRRLFELLRSQHMQMNQQITFLTDGGEDIRDLPQFINPEAEHNFRASTVPNPFKDGISARFIKTIARTACRRYPNNRFTVGNKMLRHAERSGGLTTQEHIRDLLSPLKFTQRMFSAPIDIEGRSCAAEA